jgi:flagellar protein FliO/FliZ
MDSPDLISSTLTMIAALAVVLGILLAVLMVMKKMMARGIGGRDGSLVTVLGSRYLGVKKSILLVQVPGAVLVVGIAGDRLSLLTRLDPEDVDAVAPAKGFSDTLRQVTRGAAAPPKEP